MEHNFIFQKIKSGNEVCQYNGNAGNYLASIVNERLNYKPFIDGDINNWAYKFFLMVVIEVYTYL